MVDLGIVKLVDALSACCLSGRLSSSSRNWSLNCLLKTLSHRWSFETLSDVWEAEKDLGNCSIVSTSLIKVEESSVHQMHWNKQFQLLTTMLVTNFRESGCHSNHILLV